MGCILLGVVVAIVFMLVAMNFSSNDNAIVAPAAFIVTAAIFIGLFCPVSGYEEPVKSEEIALVSLTGDTVATGGGVVYVNVSANNVYTYRYKVKSEFAKGNDVAYESDTISGENVTVIEGDSYTTAKLVTYKLKPKRNFWTFAVGASTYKYVFYVPTGTIQGNITLD